MPLNATYKKKVFHFGFDARTSRGRMKDKTAWFIKLWDSKQPNVVGWGECGPLPGLSVDDRPDFESVLDSCLAHVSAIQHQEDIVKIVPAGFPSIRFGLEAALLDLRHGGVRKIYNNSFFSGTPIPINGLVWMGDLDSMLQQVSLKIAQGFRCIKLKVGGLNFEKECDILQYIRSKYFREGITIRLDANGAFKPEEAKYKLNSLARYNVHSIEQPVKPGLVAMEELCRSSPIPIALDEELIGVALKADKIKLLDRIRPQFIILKPSLHGGLLSCAEWIALAEERNIGWWITSALESNIGLNAICQFTANYTITMPQGLGTGKIYQDNIPSPLTVSEGTISYDAKKSWDIQEPL
ncbi:MAG: o-succinylbenzoate synthase [Cyclobacteriaceae bacterium]|nr:o-succinylbenzoate synthase [Cyclobacteriaceae bacterium]UYN85869.1 MAG: o-succinylbenzoate synthase [Cyclobacteriaceae bacterium]